MLVEEKHEASAGGIVDLQKTTALAALRNMTALNGEDSESAIPCVLCSVVFVNSAKALNS